MVNKFDCFRNFLCFGIALLFSLNSFAQTNFILPYQDYRNYLYVFENGTSRQLESQPVRTFAGMGPNVAYINTANDVYLYTNGEKNKLGDATGINYDFTNQLFYYRLNDALTIFDNGKINTLSFFLLDFKIIDGIVAFRDQNQNVLKVYYKGQVQEVDLLALGRTIDYKVGENTVAFMNSMNYFKVFHDGELYEIDNTAPEVYIPGKNIVAYIDGRTQALKVFYNRKILTLEDIKPLSMQVGDDLVAYVTDENAFKIFANGKLLKAESYVPEFYKVLDNSVLFFVNNKLQLIQNGNRYELSNFNPKSYKMSQDNIAWVDPTNRLYLFSEGKSKLVTTELFESYELNGNVLRYLLPDGSYKFFYKGEQY